MSVVDTRIAYVPAAPGLSSTLAATLVSSVIHWMNVRATRKALGRLTDRELDDIGLTRSDIERVAHEV